MGSDICDTRHCDIHLSPFLAEGENYRPEK